MTRKDFELIAASLRAQLAKHAAGSPEHEAIKGVVGDLTARLQTTNPAFRPAQFVAACHGAK